MTALQDQPDVH